VDHGTPNEGPGESGEPPSPATTSGRGDSADAFDRLGLAARFDLDLPELDRAWIRLAAGCHPDRAADPVAAAEASRRTAALNEARAVLREPERRADVLLTRLGGPTSADEKALPPSFLAEMMELRERVEDAAGGGDDRSRREIEEEVAAERDRRISRIASLFEDAAGAPDRLREIRLELNVLRYHERLLAELRGTAAT